MKMSLGQRVVVFVSLIMVTGLGAGLAAWPHGFGGLSQTRVFAADRDELLYLAWSREIVNRGAWRLADAVHPQSGPLMHPPALFLPQTLFARALGATSETIGRFWRLFAGAGLALGLVWALWRSWPEEMKVRYGFYARWCATLFAATFLLCDPGLILGQPVYRTFWLWVDLRLPEPTVFQSVPDLLPQFRVVTPGLAYFAVLLWLGMTLRARGLALSGSGSGSGSEARSAAIAAGAALGIVIAVYFYFWTTALAALALATLCDVRAWRVYVVTATVGLIAGSPALIQGAWIQSATLPDWLHRTEKFVPIGWGDEWLAPKTPLALIALTGVAVLRYRRDLTVVWTMACAAYLLMNHQVLTSLQIENFHFRSALGLALSVLTGMLVLPLLVRFAFAAGRSSRVAAATGLAVILALQIGWSASLRVWETTRTRDTRTCLTLADAWRDGTKLWIPPRTVTAGDPAGQLVGAAFGEVYPITGRLADFSALVSDPERAERLAVNLWIWGVSSAEAAAIISGNAEFPGWDWWVAYRDRPDADRRALGQAAADAVWADPRAALRRWNIRAILLPTSRNVSPDAEPLPWGSRMTPAWFTVAQQRWGDWATPLGRNATWEVWSLAP